MVSIYQYITVAELEAYTGMDYSAIDALFTNTVIEAQISNAERMVNGIKRTSYTTVPDDVEAATYILSQRLMNNMIIEYGYGFEGEIKVQVIDEVIIKILSALSAAKYDYKLRTSVTDNFFD